MKLNNAPTHPAEYSNNVTTSEFSIKASAKAFQILSDGLYSDKIKAIIRELACNAYDSHVEAGKKDIPFEVHLPTAVSPYFSVKDYGVGLSHEQVTKIYTTYFESTKTDSDDYIGALGLGSKSPFSYTDNFTVTAIKDGQKNSYSAYINEHGVPSVARLASTDTVESNGVEVKFAVEDGNDISEFSSKAATVLKWFGLQPVLTGGKIHISELHVVSTIDLGDRVSVINPNKSGIKGCHAIMGNIAYPVGTASLTESSLKKANISETDIKNIVNILKHETLLLKFGIGEIEFSASRESLSLTEKTIKAIADLIINVHTTFKDSIKKSLDIDNSSDPWELTLKIAKMYIGSSFLKGSIEEIIKEYPSKFIVNIFKNSYDRDAVWHPTKIDIAVVATKFGLEIKLYNFSHKQILRPTQPISTPDKNPLLPQSSFYHLLENRFPYVGSPEHYLKNIFFLCDTGDKPIPNNHISHHFKNESNGSLFLLRPIDLTAPYDFKGFLEYVANPPAGQILDQTSITRPKPDSKIVYKPDDCLLLYHVTNEYYSHWSSNKVWHQKTLKDIQAAQSPISNKYFYVNMKGYDVLHHDGSVLTQDIKMLTDSLIGTAVHNDMSRTVYGVREKYKKIIEQDSQWVELTAYIKDAIIKISRTEWEKTFIKSAIDADLSRFLRHIKNDETRILNMHDSLQCLLNLNESSITAGDAANYKKMYEVAKILGSARDISSISDNCGKLVPNFSNRYPLLTSYTIGRRELYQPMVDYINYIDHTKSQSTRITP